MPKITAQIIAKDEEEMLPACLASLSWADEILLVDSGSTDRTLEIARAAGCRVLTHAFEGFSAQFNWGIGQAAHPWLFIVDADEVVDPELAAAIRRLMASEPELEVYQVLRDAFFLGHRMRASSWSGEPLPRLFRKGSLTYRGLVHPVADSGGRPLGKLPGRLLHYTYRDMAQYFRKFDLYTTLWAENAQANGVRAGLPAIFLRSGWRFLHNYFIRGEILDGKYGLLTATLSVMYTFIKYIKLWGLRHGHSAGGGG
ncbi:MAG: glycosyltransferase family 2 protein [Planctomycetota bacterium]|jgi:(heptosyl)LPS beta-1,4-glucosyltransferase|nr:glycosyltransferase family 2 protein [Planctomycetota bacterium]